MTDNFLGEIRLFPMNWAPQGWHVCDGTVLPITGNQALYSLIGIAYGGDGKTTFALPDLRGRTGVNYGPGINPASEYILGAKNGAETVTLTANTIPQHNHNVGVNPTAANGNIPGNTLAMPTGINFYNTTLPAGSPTLVPETISTVGNNTPHQNMQPFQVLNFCIATSGLYPTRP